MRLENCIRRWLGLKAHRVVTIREIAGELIAEIQPLRGRMPRCGCCGQKVRRTKGRMPPRRWRDLKIRTLPLILSYAPRRVVCPTCGVRVEQVPWAQRWSRVTITLARSVSVMSRRT